MYANLKPSKAGDFDKVELKANEAKRVFHALNRSLSLLDELLHDGSMDPADERAYNTLNDLANSLARVLDPGQENKQ